MKPILLSDYPCGNPLLLGLTCANLKNYRQNHFVLQWLNGLSSFLFYLFPNEEKVVIFTVGGMVCLIPVKNSQYFRILLFTYSGKVGFRFWVGFIGNPFFCFSYHFGSDGEIVIGVVADVELSGFEEAPFLEEVGQVGFCDVAACSDEFKLVFDGIIPSVVSRVVAQVFHDVRVEVGMSVFGKVEMELPQGDQFVEDIL